MAKRAEKPPAGDRQAGRRQLQEIVSGLHEGVILIDPADGIVWANASALDMHGVKALAELGTGPDDYRERFTLLYRNHHRLAPEQYPIDRVLAGDFFRDVVVEVTHASSNADEWRCIQELRAIKLTDERNRLEAIAIVAQDVTERYAAEERFERTFAANPAPAVICRLADLRYIKVNQGFLDLSLYSRDDVVGRSAYELDVLRNAENRDEAVAAFREGRTIPQTEATLDIADGGSRFVIVAGQPIEVGDEACMLFTFMDLDPRKRAEDSLRESEERFARSFRLTPVPTMLSAQADFRVIDVNDAFLSVFGYSEEELIGRRGGELRIWSDAKSRKQLERAIEKDRVVRGLEIKLRDKQGAELDCLLSAECVAIREQDCVLLAIQDISERKRSEVELIEAIEAVMKDSSWLGATIVEKLANLRHPSRASSTISMSNLTAREQDILGLMCQGRSDAKIAEALKLSRHTVRNHVSRIYGKIDAHTRAEAIVWARERGFVGPDAARKKQAAPKRV